MRRRLDGEGPAPRVKIGRPPDLGDAASRRVGERLQPYLERPLEVTLTDNRSTIIYVRRWPEHLEARVHHMFVHAPQTVILALARYIETADRISSQALGYYINGHQRLVRGPARRRRPVSRTMRTRGKTHDLAELFDRLNADYFTGKIDARITWGPRRNHRGRRLSMKMGSYSVEDRIIRINPSLDQPFVPRYFIGWIVYHEMLHQLHDIPRVNGRRQFHTPAFQLDERRFIHHERARRWERRNLDRLLAS